MDITETYLRELVKSVVGDLETERRRFAQVDRSSREIANLSGAGDGVLLSTAGVVSVGAADVSSGTNVSGVLRVTNGGTAQSSMAKGNIVAGTAVAGTTAKLAAGADGLPLVSDSAETGGWKAEAIPESSVTNLVSDLAGKVPTSRTISTTAPVTGGGDLSANRTIAITGYTFLQRTVLSSGTGATFTPNGSTRLMKVLCVGPGGGGGGVSKGASNAAGAAGGGAGGACEKIAANSGTYTYTVGTGGAGGTAGNNPGSAGSAASTFSGTNFTLSAGAGNGGGGMAAGTALAFTGGGTGGSCSGGDWNAVGNPGNPGIRLSGTVSAGSPGGGSIFAGGGAGRLTNGVGIASTSIGCGGGGANEQANGSDRVGGNGTDGLIIVDEYA